MRVPMSPNLIYSIKTNTAKLFEEERKEIVSPTHAPPGVGDLIYGSVLNLHHEEQIRSLMPDWQYDLIDHVTVLVQPLNSDNGYTRSHTPHVEATFSKARLAIPRRGTIYSVKGIAKLRWDVSTVTISPATDGSTIDDLTLREFVEKMSTIYDQHRAVTEKVVQAEADIEKFLSQHKTLQSAVKEMGPSLLEFVPPRTRQLYEQAGAKQEAPKPAVKVDTSYIAARATLNKLGLDGDAATVH